MRPSVKVASVAAVFVIGVAATVSLADSTEPDKPVHKQGQAESVKPKPKKADESKDLVYFKMDDRSTSWLDDIWLKWKITNNSSETSDYSWEWDAIDTSTGERVDSGTAWEDNVKPGQTVNGDTFTSLDKADGIKINIYDFDRVKSW